PLRSAPRGLDVPKAYKGITPSVEGIDVTFDTVFYGYNDPPAVVTASFSSGEAIRLYIGKDEALFAVMFDCNQQIVTAPAKLAALRIPTINALPQVAPFLKEESVLVDSYVKRFMNTDRAPLHFRNELFLFQDAYRRFKELAEASWHGLRIRELRQSGDQLQLFTADSDLTAEVAWMGHGLQMWLQAMWFIARTDGRGAVILDEPDVYLHADLQRKLIRLVVKSHEVVCRGIVHPGSLIEAGGRQTRQVDEGRSPDEHPQECPVDASWSSRSLSPGAAAGSAGAPCWPGGAGE